MAKRRDRKGAVQRAIGSQKRQSEHQRLVRKQLALIDLLGDTRLFEQTLRRPLVILRDRLTASGVEPERAAEIALSSFGISAMGATNLGSNVIEVVRNMFHTRIGNVELATVSDKAQQHLMELAEHITPQEALNIMVQQPPRDSTLLELRTPVGLRIPRADGSTGVAQIKALSWGIPSDKWRFSRGHEDKVPFLSMLTLYAESSSAEFMAADNRLVQEARRILDQRRRSRNSSTAPDSVTNRPVMSSGALELVPWADIPVPLQEDDTLSTVAKLAWEAHVASLPSTESLPAARFVSGDARDDFTLPMRLLAAVQQARADESTAFESVALTSDDKRFADITLSAPRFWKMVHSSQVRPAASSSVRWSSPAADAQFQTERLAQVRHHAGQEAARIYSDPLKHQMDALMATPRVAAASMRDKEEYLKVVLSIPAEAIDNGVIETKSAIHRLGEDLTHVPLYLSDPRVTDRFFQAAEGSPIVLGDVPLPGESGILRYAHPRLSKEATFGRIDDHALLRWRTVEIVGEPYLIVHSYGDRRSPIVSPWRETMDVVARETRQETPTWFENYIDVLALNPDSEGPRHFRVPGLAYGMGPNGKMQDPFLLPDAQNDLEILNDPQGTLPLRVLVAFATDLSEGRIGFGHHPQTPDGVNEVARRNPKTGYLEFLPPSVDLPTTFMGREGRAVLGVRYQPARRYDHVADDGTVSVRESGEYLQGAQRELYPDVESYFARLPVDHPDHSRRRRTPEDPKRTATRVATGRRALPAQTESGVEGLGTAHRAAPEPSLPQRARPAAPSDRPGRNTGFRNS